MNDVCVLMPWRLSADDLDAVRNDPLCAVGDKDEMNKRIGWLICAYDAMVARRTNSVNPEPDNS